MPAMKKAKSTRRTTSRKPTPRRATARTAKSGLSLRSVTPSLTVNDISRSLAWYCDVVGFKVKERWEHDGTLMGAEIAAGTATFYVGQDDWKKGRDRVKGEGFRLYCTTSQDVDALAAQIEARGGQLLDKPHDMEWGGRAFAVVDPDGFKITISKG